MRNGGEPEPQIIVVSEEKKTTVLLVEDSEDDAYLFNWRFEQSEVSCAVEHVLDGSAAIDFLRNKSAEGCGQLPHLIFLDLKMPVMNGFELLSWLREHTVFSQIPVIVLSGSDQQRDKERSFQLGAADYLVKPVKVADIQRLLADVCPASPGQKLKGHKAQT